MSHKYVYLFTEGNGKMRELLGGKGANLAEMTRIGLPVPQGFTISTEACTKYYEDGQKINDEIMAQIMDASPAKVSLTPPISIDSQDSPKYSAIRTASVAMRFTGKRLVVDIKNPSLK